MRRQIEGSAAIAEAVAACEPEVICAYPITPQTHIVEALGVMVRKGRLPRTRFVNVESEFGALSVALGASAAGARSYTATASQGLLFMAEAVYNTAGLGLPVVMTLANRAVGAPINIWNDHSDAMAVRDSGWLQLWAEDSQAAVDLHIQAFRIAETLSLPVMVCVDGFLITHALDSVELPEPDRVKKFLPPYVPRQSLDPDNPLSIGAMVGPDAFEEVRYLAHLRALAAPAVISEVSGAFQAAFGRPGVQFVSGYRLEGARTVIVAMGSVLGTLEDAVDELREEGMAVGVVGLGVYRPFPSSQLAEALSGADNVVVVDRALAPGQGGYLAPEVRATVGFSKRVVNVIAGLGGRPVLKRSIISLLRDVEQARADELVFLDLNRQAVASEEADIRRLAVGRSRMEPVKEAAI
jgi:pyruvate ferredoxin oxidoreductase alpha subunit